MRIGIDATTIYTAAPTGLGVYTINMVNELARLHDDLVVWTVDDSRLEVAPQKIRKILQPFKALGNHLFQLRPFWLETSFAGALRREGVDVLYSTIPNGLADPPVPHAVTVHDLIPLRFPSDSPRSVRWNFRYRLPKIFANAAKVIAVSEFTRQDVLREYAVDPVKVRLVSEGYDRDCFAPKSDPAVLGRYGLKEKGYLLYIGNSSPRKNLSLVIEAFGRIKERIPHRLVLAGTKSSREIASLQKRLRENAVQDRVTLVDYLPFRELPVFYSGAAVFLFPSHYEGFGLPVLEAMACGTPVMAADATSLPEVTGDAAILVDPCDPAALGDQLCSFLDAPDRLRHFSQAGLQRARGFSWSASAGEVLEILKEIQRGGRR